MHHLAVKSNLVDVVPGPTKIGFRPNDLPLCPKPRRPTSSIPELLKCTSTTTHCSQTNPDGRSDILNIITNKTTTEERDSVSYYYSGSPPSRTDNPLVHDVHFIHQVELFSPLPRSKLSDKFGFTSASPI